ncbi:MAG: peptidase M56 BlaR1 [Firmicutes bacterium HGW-Firmicutes-8]|nr:MAG: peptidase M56 BlaR1 [Firmicutes bacterium HGW-Firmicutes-8]
MRFKPLSVRTFLIGVALTAGIITGTLTFGPAIASNLSNQQVPVFPKNENGQTYGSSALVNSPDQEPDLISAVGEGGVEGYLRAVDLDEEMPKTPKEAVARNNKHKPDDVIEIPLYDVDGKTVIGVFKHSHGRIIEIPAKN